MDEMELRRQIEQCSPGTAHFPHVLRLDPPLAAVVPIVRYLSLPFPSAEQPAPGGPAKPALIAGALLLCRRDDTVADASCSTCWEAVGAITRPTGWWERTER